MHAQIMWFKVRIIQKPLENSGNRLRRFLAGLLMSLSKYRILENLFNSALQVEIEIVSRDKIRYSA